MEVKEPPQGVTPPVQSTVRRSSQQPSRLRKFVLQNSAGLRIRTHPSLQSEQVGTVHVNGTIAFVDEVRGYGIGALAECHIELLFFTGLALGLFAS